jgi:RecG-like helicase
LRCAAALRCGVVLSFELPAAQQRVLEEVLGDMAAPSPLFRLLQAQPHI